VKSTRGNNHAQETFVRAALEYAHAGLPIFPCRDKKPLVKNGFYDATADVPHVTNWWTTWPDAEIAMRCGVHSGRVVLDSDPRNGGDKSLAVLAERHGKANTLVARTPSGGFHFHFLCRGLTLPKCELAPGLDFQGEGSYVIMPPSVLPNGRTYTWVNGVTSPGELPQWLETLVLDHKQPASSMHTNGERVPVGGRNRFLVSRAGGYRRKGDSPETIYRKLLLDYEDRCSHEPPVTDKEIRQIAKWVERFEPAAPEPEPPPPAPPPPTSCPEPEPPGRLPVTDVSNGERLVRRYGDEIRYASDRNTWCAWDEKIWRVNDVMGMNRRMQEVARDIYHEAAAAGSEELRKALAKWAPRSESQTVQEHSIDAARCHVEVRRFSDTFDLHPSKIVLRNSTIELKGDS
jgi:putative DNA primase/helicase